MRWGRPAFVHGFIVSETGHPEAVTAERNDPPATPRDATRATDEQRDLQQQLDHRHDDPDAPGRQQDHHSVADET
jgi:hypothetical protein